MNSSLTLQQALRQAHQQGLARIDAQMLLLHVLDQPGASRAWLLTHDQDPLSHDQQAQFAQLCAQRLDGVPVAYLTGCKEFFGLPLQVDARVLDPRPDTETLVEWVLDVVEKIVSPRVADLGTGSGAIALALAHERPLADVTAVDASAGALQVALDNAASLGLRLRGLLGSWFAPVAGERFDLIVSNPPYIAEGDPHMAALRFEPESALTAGPDGLDDLRHIIEQAPHHLVPGGWLLLEHGFDQANAVMQLLQNRGFTEVSTRFDLGPQARCTGGRLPA